MSGVFSMNRRRLAGDESGAVAPIFAISGFALLVVIGATLDYTRMEKARGELQAGTDGAAISLAIDRTRGLKDTQLSDVARQRMAAGLSREVLDNLRLVGAEGHGSKVHVKSVAAVQLGFSGVLGKKEVLIEAAATADYGPAGRARRSEIALALDLTGGMNDNGKLGALKSSVQWYLDKAGANADSPDAIKIALVPFAEQVKLNTVYRPAAWLSFAGQEQKPKLTGEQQSKASSDPMAAARLLLKTHQLKVERIKWNGCVADVNDPTTLAFDAANRHPATMCPSQEWNGTAANAVEPLSREFAQMRQKADKMQAEGCANPGIGLVWAFGALSPQLPFGGAAAFGDPETRKSIVLVSSAPVAVDREHGICIARSQKDQRLEPGLRNLCEKIKRRGVTIYTVNLVGGDKELLTACASDGKKYHEAKAAGDLRRVFEEIAKETLEGSPKVARLVE